MKVRPNNGATTVDMFDHLRAFLRKKPSHLILHVGENDASRKNTSSDDIFDNLMDLKKFAEEKVAGLDVLISCPTLRLDDNLANVKLRYLRNRLKRSGMKIISNDNIASDHIGSKGLHLNKKGTANLASNFCRCIQYL